MYLIQISIHRAPTFSKALIKRHDWIRVFYENKTQRAMYKNKKKEETSSSNRKCNKQERQYRRIIRRDDFHGEGVH